MVVTFGTLDILAAAFILRRALDTEHMSRRISENTEGQLERATRIIAQSMKAGS